MKIGAFQLVVGLLLLWQPGAAFSCPVELFHDQREVEQARIEKRLRWAQLPDPADGPIIERPKQLTLNFRTPGLFTAGSLTESADNTRPLKMSDGTWRIDATGQDGYHVPSLSSFLRGGSQDQRRFPILRRWADGTLAQGEAAGWDGFPARWPVFDSTGKVIGEKLVGYLGMMEQPYKLIGAGEEELAQRAPSWFLYNYTRSRWALDIEWVNGLEIWTARRPVFGNRPLAPSQDPRLPLHERGQWRSAQHQHGYGGRPLMDNEGRVIIYDGTPWMIYEMVTEQKRVDHGEGLTGYLPWVTEVVATRMKSPDEAYAPGERLPDGRRAEAFVKLCSVRNKDGSFNAASDRHGIGYLIEGFNLMGEPIPIGKKRYWVGFASPNNYTGSYGVTMWIREESLGPIGEYEPLVDRFGVWRDITGDFRSKYGMPAWFGRGDGFLTPEQLEKIRQPGLHSETAFQLIAHGINPQSLPKHLPFGGWPNGADYPYYLRSQWLLFGRFFENGEGKPDVRWSLPEPPGQ